MTKALHLLQQAREDLLVFQTDAALVKMQEFEVLVHSGAMPRDRVAETAELLRDILSLASAACDGVAAAQRQLAEIAALSRHLNTYDRQGRRIGNPISSPHDRRF
ncbi:hypothetical protein EQ718_18615 (plasmid) [Paracoccus versutus]|uniref:Uncharacterized protein n=1 Tax=Paracoccus versutus TaxID=34007 RepID=A0AAQ0HHJ5_PARVE|nr:hypothetical protein [Paracoccus versutus]REG46649.1 hypothetical protein ATH84_101442 [Paracoccus versutus]WEJ80915.1 hypothetical protein EQ718_18615 [Paracoccus versutus]